MEISLHCWRLYLHTKIRVIIYYIYNKYISEAQGFIGSSIDWSLLGNRYWYTLWIDILWPISSSRRYSMLAAIELPHVRPSLLSDCLLHGKCILKWRSWFVPLVMTKTSLSPAGLRSARVINIIYLSIYLDSWLSRGRLSSVPWT